MSWLGYKFPALLRPPPDWSQGGAGTMKFILPQLSKWLEHKSWHQVICVFSPSLKIVTFSYIFDRLHPDDFSSSPPAAFYLLSVRHRPLGPETRHFHKAQSQITCNTQAPKLVVVNRWCNHLHFCHYPRNSLAQSFSPFASGKASVYLSYCVLALKMLTSPTI